MKGVVAALVAASLLACIGIVMANPPLPEPLQYAQFCEQQKVSGTGTVDVSTSIQDKKLALEYYNVKNGDGDFELDQTDAYSQKAINQGHLFNDSHNSSLNLLEKEKMTYSGKVPLIGGKYINSKSFYGGIGADVQETYMVNQMEKDQTTFFASTANLDNGSPNTQEVMNKQLKQAGLNDQMWNNNNNVTNLMTAPDGTVDPAHMIGMDTKNSFKGMWGIDAKQHQIFWKDIKIHEMFNGTFEAEKLVKFHENPVPENELNPCKDIDC